ncbi:zeta toxin family protein [Pseudomonas sp. TH08]|uniref:zeta toxin family protein n=1 Tax=unclassified Pseudomonas TaxID=196821 RepID=UPI0019112781|nr:MULTISPECIES: zeta toxin family protein [unclassified Pseudomonas]MBK5530102.1 zeta toxin family protein [Pseudomonas sp. TH06]MBK5536577.1 zeta toxin family protein [Pseudomonas sp. TH08]
MSTPRIRIFAGPNGSGKSTFNRLVPAHLRGNYINPDDIERAIKDTGYFDFTSYHIESHKEQIFDFLRQHALLEKSPRSLAKLDSLTMEGERLNFANTEIDSYVASALSDFIRRSLIRERISFTFETVMSSSDKVNLLADAHNSGYRVYVYYVATADPEINIARVAYRVSQGGHSVPPEKIRARYWRSLELLSEAILTSNRAYIFDNSDEGSEGLTQIAEITDGELIEIKSDIQPPWFKEFVLDKLL